MQVKRLERLSLQLLLWALCMQFVTILGLIVTDTLLSASTDFLDEDRLTESGLTNLATDVSLVATRYVLYLSMGVLAIGGIVRGVAIYARRRSRVRDRDELVPSISSRLDEVVEALAQLEAEVDYRQARLTDVEREHERHDVLLSMSRRQVEGLRDEIRDATAPSSRRQTQLTWASIVLTIVIAVVSLVLTL